MLFSIITSGGCTNNTQNMATNLEQVTYAAETRQNDVVVNNPQIMQNNASVNSASVNSASVAYRKNLSTFVTTFNEGSVGRKNNITIAAKSINGVIIPPGEIFSFNDTVGPTTRQNGFSLAKVFHKGKELKGYGGGVCQVSSTLYNSAEAAGMEIIERHPHSKRVYYVPENRDAATSYGKVDFKFKNILTTPVIISTSVKDGKLTVNLDSISA